MLEELTGPQHTHLLFVALDVGVASGTEDMNSLDLHPTKQPVQVVDHHVLEWYKPVLAQRDPALHLDGQRHDGEACGGILLLGVLGVRQDDRKIQSQRRQIWEGMA